VLAMLSSILLVQFKYIYPTCHPVLLEWAGIS
jgi:hypothetical protein